MGVNDARRRMAGERDEPLRRPRRGNVGERDDLALRSRIATDGNLGQEFVARHSIDVPAAGSRLTKDALVCHSGRNPNSPYGG